ncbi:MAG: alcohol dehydrogenase catalytic domain-containing protein [Hyphomicrobiaceae bacterium]|nr:alcohol dehydrogenase catalytic domain-containing protein [Hyphomicrobiaceae bacterium]
MPTAGDGEVVLKVAFCGICGSDVHATEASASQVGRGTVLGHEFSGEVIASGDPAWKPGDRAIAVPLQPCDDCRAQGVCSDGLGILCPRNRVVGMWPEVPGGYAEYVRVGARQLLAVPEGVALDAAALAEPLAVGAHAVRLAGQLLGRRVLIVGAGPIGLATAAFAARAGARDVIVSEIDGARRERAGRLGATALIDPSTASVADQFLALAGGPPEVVFECVGVPGLLRQCFDLAAVRGRVVVVGVCRHEDAILPRVPLRKELLVQFVLGYTPEDFRLSLDLLLSPGFPASDLITRRVTFEELPAVFESLRHPNPEAKVLLEPFGRRNDITSLSGR